MQKPLFDRWVFLVPGLLIVSCGGQPEPEGTSFAKQVLPLLNRHCAICHLSDDAQGGFSLYPRPYESLVAVKSTQSPLALVEPGSPRASYVYHKLMGSQETVNGSGVSMPYQRDPLHEAELSVIRQWIDEGANNN